MNYTLHGSISSPFVRKVRYVLAAKNVPYRLALMDVFNPPKDFETLSPLRRIPVLAFDGKPERKPLPDSSAICAYLEAAYPSPPLLSADPYERARALWIEEYSDTNFAYRIGFSVTRPILHPGNKPLDHAKMAEDIEQKINPLMAYLEGELESQTWFVADRFSLADIAVSTQLAGLYHAGRLDILAPFPRLSAFLERMMELPIFAAQIAEETKAHAERAKVRASQNEAVP